MTRKQRKEFIKENDGKKLQGIVIQANKVDKVGTKVWGKYRDAMGKDVLEVLDYDDGTYVRSHSAVVELI